MILFNIPTRTGKEKMYIDEAISINNKISGDGVFTHKCSSWIENRFNTPKVLLTTSGTDALEMAAILSNIEPGDEIIAPSYTFVSTVNAFVLRGAKIVFVDIRPDTMNINEKLIEEAITEKTKAIIPVHYAGVACEMDKILEIAHKHNLIVIEDAAQGFMSSYKGQALGTLGDIGCFSFHETKNYTMGEGGAILIQKKDYIERAEIIREKGTNRSKFYRGQVDKYSWVDIGSSFLPSELNAAYLYAQLEEADLINDNRLLAWNMYHTELKVLANQEKISLPVIPEGCIHNSHMYYIKCKDLRERELLIKFLNLNGVLAVFHYIPLHSSEAGKKYSRFHGTDRFTTIESEKLLRLPLYFNISLDDIQYIIEKIKEFYKNI